MADAQRVNQYLNPPDLPANYIDNGDGTWSVQVAVGEAVAGAVTIADGADATLGAKADAAVITDATASVNARLRGLVNLIVARILGPSATGTQSIVASSASSVTILASNSSRKGASVSNDSGAILYLLVGAGTASATVFTLKMGQDDYYEVPFSYTGDIKGIWASATGSARVMEWT